MTRTLRINGKDSQKRGKRRGGRSEYLLAAAAFCIFAFRLRTLSCRALIPSVGVTRPSPGVPGVLEEAGLSRTFEGGGMVSFGSFVFVWVLLNLRPMSVDFSSCEEELSRAVKSSMSIRSATWVSR